MRGKAPDGTIFETHGIEGGPVVILIHGLGLNRECWEWTIPALSDRYCVVTYDLFGHGESSIPPETPSLTLFARQLSTLMDYLKIDRAAIAGFSLGGMIARRFAQDFAPRTTALAILHSPHRREPDAQAAILARVEQARTEGSAATVEAALERWFTEPYRAANPKMMNRVRGWVLANETAVYHTIYRVLAEGVEEIVAPDPPLDLPMLAMTGDEDYGNGPEMTRAIAAEVEGAEAVILHGLRHMALAEDPDEVNRPLRDFLDRVLGEVSPPLSDAERRALRDAFGCFATGVTVVTTRQDDGMPRGFTANSFTSVSLDPPMLLVCVAKTAHSCPVFSAAPHFAVNILEQGQKDLSGLFASRATDKFEQTDWQTGAAGMPVFDKALSHLICAREKVIDAGDHIILLGRVIDHSVGQGQPLGYFKGTYFSAGIEQDLIDVASHGGEIEVGALISADGSLLLAKSDGGGLEVPKAPAGSSDIDALMNAFARSDLRVDLEFLYAVFRDSSTGRHGIFYHGSATGTPPTGHKFYLIDNLPLSEICSAAERSMLTRYVAEHREGAFGIYQGDETCGTVNRIASREPSQF